jgi:PBP1b-binding outer membrane lipoprotein LpoB
MKKILAIVLSLMLLAVFAVGCKKAETPAPAPAPAAAPATTPAPEKPADVKPADAKPAEAPKK